MIGRGSHSTNWQLDSSDLEAIRLGKFELDCLSIVLVRELREVTTTYSGTGYIRQNREGRLTFKLYSTQPTSLIESYGTGEVEAGQILSAHMYYRLVATDMQGRQWSSDRVLIHIDNGPSDSGFCVSGWIDELKTSNSFPVPNNNHYLRMWFSGNYDIHCNLFSEVIQKVEGQERGSQSERNIAKFSACGCEFYLKKEKDYLLVSVSGETLPEQIEYRVTEALEFALAQPMQCYAVERLRADNLSYTIFGMPTTKFVGRTGRPLSSKHCFRYGDNFWKLYFCYLKYIFDYQPASYHPISHMVHSIIVASEASLEAQALTLSVAVENLLKIAFPNEGNHSDSFLNDLKIAEDAVMSSSIAVETKNRIGGLFSTMKNSGAKDQLRALVSRKAINKQQFDTWKKIRNATAHGDTGSLGTRQELLTLCAQTHVLFYHLIFIAIGYEGPYTDYGILGWPCCEYKIPLSSRPRRLA